MYVHCTRGIFYHLHEVEALELTEVLHHLGAQLRVLLNAPRPSQPRVMLSLTNSMGGVREVHEYIRTYGIRLSTTG